MRHYEIVLMIHPDQSEQVPAMLERYKGIEPKRRTVATIAAIAIALVVLYRLPGIGSWFSDKAPFAVVVIGLVLGTVTALLAMGLILIYRTNRFINFAYGSMGSLAGVLAVGMHLQHGWSFWLALPVGVIGGALVGGLVEVLVIRRFSNASRLILTVASIGFIGSGSLAQAGHEARLHRQLRLSEIEGLAGKGLRHAVDLEHDAAGLDAAHPELGRALARTHAHFLRLD